MKLLFTLIITIIFVSCSDDIQVTENEKAPTFCDCNELILDTDYQRYYLTDKEKPFTGKCTTLKPDGKKVLENDYIDGKYDGVVKIYYENGELKSTTEYENNLLTGNQKIYSLDGSLISHAIYSHSKLIEIIK
jgi:antitoxin component YwqK of YwqJK toxin-antitoxin module